MKNLEKLISNKNGQGILEYIILSGLIGIICLAAVKTVGTSIQTRVKQINKKIVHEIRIK